MPLGGGCTRAVLPKKNLFYLFTNGFAEYTVFLSYKMDPIQVTALDEFGSIQKLKKCAAAAAKIEKLAPQALKI